jgi:hypothetical protein
MKSTLKSFNESESRLSSLAKSSASGLDYTAFSLFSGLVGSACSDNPAQAINDENGYCKLQVKFARMKSTLKSFNESESRLPSLAKSSANGLDLTLSAQT